MGVYFHCPLIMVDLQGRERAPPENARREPKAFLTLRTPLRGLASPPLSEAIQVGQGCPLLAPVTREPPYRWG